MERSPAVQPRLARFFKSAESLTSEDLEHVRVQAVSSRHVVKKRRVEVADPEEEATVEVLLEKEEAEHERSKGRQGRHAMPVEDRRGRFNGVDKSNRLQLGQERRREDVGPWEGVVLILILININTY